MEDKQTKCCVFLRGSAVPGCEAQKQSIKGILWVFFGGCQEIQTQQTKTQAMGDITHPAKPSHTF